MTQLRVLAAGLAMLFLATSAQANRAQQLLEQSVAIQRVLGDGHFKASHPVVHEWLERLAKEHNQDSRSGPLIEDYLNNLEAFLRVNKIETHTVLNAIKHAAYACRKPDRPKCDFALTSVIVVTANSLGASKGPMTPKTHK